MENVDGIRSSDKNQEEKKKTAAVCDNYIWSIAAQILWLNRYQPDQPSLLEARGKKVPR